MENENTSQVCPICGKDKHMGRKAKPLYGQLVCKKCYDGFSNRRQAAFLIDLFLWYVAIAVLGSIVRQPLSEGMELLAGSVAWLVFFLKDGFSGHSPGKVVLGVQVIHDPTGQPAGFGVSFKRNLPLIVPFVVLLVAFELRKGYRLGDSWAKTKVIWKKHKDEAPFAVGIVAQE